MNPFWGWSHLGRVAARGDEHVDTTFARFLSVPLVPVGSRWVAAPNGEVAWTAPIALDGRSVLAGYARRLLPQVAAMLFVIGSTGTLIAAAALMALTFASYRWRAVRGAAAQRRSDLTLAALGTRCEPHRMHARARRGLAERLGREWAARDGVRAPEEVAADGPVDVDEAVLAYGMLRLAAADAPSSRRASLDALAERILMTDHAAPAPAAGPYRGGARVAPAAAEMAQLLAAALPVAETPAQRLARRRHTLALTAVASSAASLIAVIGVAGLARGCLYLDEPPLLDGTTMDRGNILFARVRCDRVEGPLFMEQNDHARVLDVFSVCWADGRAVALKHSPNVMPALPIVTGRLEPMPARFATVWRDQWDQFDDLRAASAAFYLEPSSAWRWARAGSRLAVLAIPLALLGWATFARRRRDLHN